MATVSTTFQSCVLKESEYRKTQHLLPTLVITFERLRIRILTSWATIMLTDERENRR